MTSHFITYRQSSIHYRKTGSGPHLTVSFHGFGEFARTFDPVAAELKDHTIIAFDLPYHGETIWREGNDITIPGLLEILRLCPEIGEKDFGLMGYSMGGRIALAIYETIPEKIAFLVLIASDGLRLNPWYWFATQTWIGKRIFRHTMKHPEWFMGLLNAGNKLGLFNESIRKFVHRYIDDTGMRLKVYQVWTTMRRFRPNLHRVKLLIRKNQTPVYLLFGKYDRIIGHGLGKSFIKNVEEWCRMEVVDAGHQLLHPRYIEYITRALEYCLNHTKKQAS